MLFHSKVVFYSFFPYFSGGVDSRPVRFFWHQYISNWTIYYVAADKNYWGDFATKSVLLTQQQCGRDFGRGNVPDIRKIQCFVEQMPHKGHSGQHRSNRSNPISQGHFQSFDWHLYKMFLVLLYFDQLVSGRSEFCKERAQGHHGGSSKLMFPKCQFLVKDSLLIFWGIPHGFPINSEILRNYAERSTISAFFSICHTSCLPKFDHQSLNCPSTRHIVPAKIFPALSLCQKN